MRIESLHIDKFGKLRNVSLEFSDGLTIVRGDNESGKTTILAFLRALLYGLNGKSASLTQNERRRYMPWGETSMGGSLRLRAGRAAWEIDRTFGQTKKQDTLRVTDLLSGEPVELPPGDEPGRALLGIDESVFVSTLFVSAQGARPAAVGGAGGAALTDRLRNLVGTGAEDVDLKAVLDRLHAARSAIAPRVKDRGQLYELQTQQDETQKRLLEAAKAQEALIALRKEVQRLTADAQQERSREGLRQNLAERERCARRLEDYRAQVRELDARIAAGSAPSAPVSRSRAPELLFLILALLLAALSVACGLLLSNYAYAGLILTALCSVLYMRCKDAREAAPTAAPAPEAAVSAARRERAMYLQEAERLSARIAALDAGLAAAQPEESAAQKRLLEARVQLATLEARTDDPQALRARLSDLSQREAALRRRLRALEMAEEEIQAAARERQRAFVPELASEVERVLSRVTAGRYARAAISQSLEISLEPESGAALQPWEFFSGGTVELMYLALRLGLIRLLEAHNGPLPTLLDDPFVLLDDARCREALSVLRDAAADGRQVLLFTCQARTDIDGAHHLTLEP